jgi:hypothetical protein
VFDGILSLRVAPTRRDGVDNGFCNTVEFQTIRLLDVVDQSVTDTSLLIPPMLEHQVERRLILPVLAARMPEPQLNRATTAARLTPSNRPDLLAAARDGHNRSRQRHALKGAGPCFSVLPGCLGSHDLGWPLLWFSSPCCRAFRRLRSGKTHRA